MNLNQAKMKRERERERERERGIDLRDTKNSKSIYETLKNEV